MNSDERRRIMYNVPGNRTEPEKSTVTPSQTLKVLAFIFGVLPPLIPITVILWRVATISW